MVREIIEAQGDRLSEHFGIARVPLGNLFGALTGDNLNGPFRNRGKRFSAINRDGVPFQWSVSIGADGGTLRFITDCGIPGMSISDRIQSTLAKLWTISNWLPLSGALTELDYALS